MRLLFTRKISYELNVYARLKEKWQSLRLMYAKCVIPTKISLRKIYSKQTFFNCIASQNCRPQF